jgi:hypothetical protein
VQTLFQEIFLLSQRLTSEPRDPNLMVIEAFCVAKYSLMMAIASMEGNSALLKKDIIVPNQKSWPETARCMGIKKVSKPCLPEECGLTERSLGTIKGKHKCLHNDPYTGGECSDKCAKPDTSSRAARVHVPPPITHPPHTPFPDVCPPHTPSPTMCLPHTAPSPTMPWPH